MVVVYAKGNDRLNCYPMDTFHLFMQWGEINKSAIGNPNKSFLKLT